MKTFYASFLLTILSFIGWNCSTKHLPEIENDDLTAKLNTAVTKANNSCKNSNPQQSLPWLRNILVKGEEDKQTKKHMGNYLGKIFLTDYQNKPVFYVRMAMGSGGIYAYIYDCTGTTVHIDGNDDPVAFSKHAEKGVLIYSNIPI